MVWEKIPSYVVTNTRKGDCEDTVGLGRTESKPPPIPDERVITESLWANAISPCCGKARRSGTRARVRKATLSVIRVWVRRRDSEPEGPSSLVDEGT